MAKIKKPAPKGGKKNAAPKKVAKRAPAKKKLTARQIDQFNADKMRADSAIAAGRKHVDAALADAATSVALAGEFMSKPLHPTVEEQALADLQRLHDLGIVKAPHLPPLSLRKRASNALSRWRSAITGLFVSKKFAEANPDTTVRERAD